VLRRFVLLIGLPALAAAAAGTPSKSVSISYDDARASIEAHTNALPAALKGKSADEIKAGWPGWVAEHQAEIRARLERGDVDSLVNFWLYGTSFTALPRATARDLAGLGDRSRVEELLLRRLDDLVAGIAAPGANERLRFARRVLDRQRISLATADGRERARTFLVEARERMIADNTRYMNEARAATSQIDQSAAQTAYSTMCRDRGLSSDTSLRANYAIEQALRSIASTGASRQLRVRRIAIVGPGLDFTDKAEGYDFYPQQTIQPFAVIDSVLRLGLAQGGDVHVTTFDVNPRVNQHLTSARQRASKGSGYTLQLPLSADTPDHQWHPDLVSYWQSVGDRVGRQAPALAPPPGAAGVRLRAVRVDPQIVLAVTPMDLDIVLERLSPLTPAESFDLILATNVLVYYDAFEQSLALANIASMLRSGGVFVTNYAAPALPPMESPASQVLPVFFDRAQRNGDTMFCYRKR
jgi:hypothetical protein